MREFKNIFCHSDIASKNLTLQTQPSKLGFSCSKTADYYTVKRFSIEEIVGTFLYLKEQWLGVASY